MAEAEDPDIEVRRSRAMVRLARSFRSADSYGLVFLMIALTYVPALWRRVMDHRVLEHYDGDITRVNWIPAGARRSSRSME